MITKYSGSGYWRDRMGHRRTGIALAGVPDFATIQAFLTAMKAYTNLGLMRIVHNTQVLEGVTGETPGTGHFDLGSYVARLNFFNYTADAAGDSPNTSMVIPAPVDSMITETKDGIWVVTEAAGTAIAALLETALGQAAGTMEFISGEVPEN